MIIEQDLGVQYQKEGLESSFKFLSIAQCSEIEKVHAEIERSADIIGELRDYRTNEPIIAGTVILEKDGEKTLESISDINGNFSFSQVKLGNYIIRAEYFGYHHYHKEVQLSLSDQTVIHQSKNIVKHDIVIADVLAVHEGILSFDDLSSIGAIESKSSNFNCLGVVVMECGMKGPSKSNLSGVVTFKNTKEAAIFANITLEQQGKMVHGVVSDEEGNFDFFNVVQGTYTLRASYVGYEDYVKEIKLKGDLNIKIEFEEGLELPSIVILGKQMIIQRCGPICGNTITEDSPFIDRFEQNDRHVKYNDSKISFFPNPASDQVHIVVGEEIETIIITSIIGQVMYRESSPNPGEKIINLYDYKNGTYFISVVKNGEILTEPLIVVGY